MADFNLGEKIFLGLIMFIGTLGVIFLVCLLTALFTMWIWNALISVEVTTAIFGVAKLTYWKSLLLNWLCSILFKATYTTKNNN